MNDPFALAIALSATVTLPWVMHDCWKSLLEPEGWQSYAGALGGTLLVGALSMGALMMLDDATGSAALSPVNAVAVWIAAIAVGRIAYTVVRKWEPAPEPWPTEWTQAVLIHLPLELSDDDGYDMIDLDDLVSEALEPHGIGVFDGEEFGPDGVTAFVYGSDAEAIYLLIEPALRSHPMTARARVELYVEPDKLLREIDLRDAV